MGQKKIKGGVDHPPLKKKEGDPNIQAVQQTVINRIVSDGVAMERI
jgi:hypothetical protein